MWIVISVDIWSLPIAEDFVVTIRLNKVSRMVTEVQPTAVTRILAASYETIPLNEA